MMQFVCGKSARAVPQVLGSGAVVMFVGIEVRLNCHMRMPSGRSSTAITPPPFLLKASPKVFDGAVTPQPELSLVTL